MLLDSIGDADIHGGQTLTHDVHGNAIVVNLITLYSQHIC